MLDFLKDVFMPRNWWGPMDWTLHILLGFMVLIAVAIVVGMILYFLHWVYRSVFFEQSFKQAKDYKGEVIEMEYVPPKTHTSFNGKTTTTYTEPEKNYVTFKTDLGITTLNSDKLYQRVRIGESLTVRSQERYVKPKYWHGEWAFDGNRLITVISEKNQAVIFNDEKEANYGQY